MTTSFEEARAVVQQQLAPQWPVKDNLTTAPWGWETSSVDIVPAGPSVAVLPPRTRPREFNNEIITENKETGEIGYENRPASQATPCGAPNPFAE